MTHRPLADERWYSTPALLRTLQTYPVAVTDTTLRMYINILSKQIDLITSQSFWPVYEAVEVRGKGSNSAQHPNRLPIITIDEVLYNASRNKSGIDDLSTDPYWAYTGTWSVLDSAFWKFQDRSVYYVSNRFPQGFINIKLDGAFGWIENSRGQVQSTVAVEFKSGMTSLTVATGHGSRFKVRDIVDLWGPTTIATPVRAIVEAVNVDVLTVDVCTDVTPVPVGSVIDTWGQVPSPLELVIAKWTWLLISGGGIGSGSFVPSGMLKKEQTDSYMWERFAPTTTAVTGEITGDPFLDRILMGYQSPPYVGYV